MILCRQSWLGPYSTLLTIHSIGGKGNRTLERGQDGSLKRGQDENDLGKKWFSPITYQPITDNLTNL